MLLEHFAFLSLPDRWQQLYKQHQVGSIFSLLGADSKTQRRSASPAFDKKKTRWARSRSLRVPEPRPVGVGSPWEGPIEGEARGLLQGLRCLDPAPLGRGTERRSWGQEIVCLLFDGNSLCGCFKGRPKGKAQDHPFCGWGFVVQSARVGKPLADAYQPLKCSMGILMEM